MSASLSLTGVSAFYAGSQILHEISLEVPRGGVVCLLGLNGMGKTTTLRAIMGLVDRVEGRITLDGAALDGTTYQRARQGITLVPEDRKVFPNLTVHENLKVALQARAEARGFTMEDVLTLFPRLEERLSQSAGTLSGGEQQMLVIARAMLANPKYLLLDEPSEGLAPFYVEIIRDAILKVREHGIGVLLVEQSLPLSKAVGDRFHVIENGELIFAAERAEIAQDDSALDKLLAVD
ncbi:ABC transporter ATP-binding protein [Rhodoligotrophos ferricapiens]|uniref:ABC transporter ATP-binding protein n=1 Tax=Rhodoligotrophos ferricapiens TaxID=3069264 RepID=UPI00315D6C04